MNEGTILPQKGRFLAISWGRVGGMSPFGIRPMGGATSIAIVFHRGQRPRSSPDHQCHGLRTGGSIYFLKKLCVGVLIIFWSKVEAAKLVAKKVSCTLRVRNWWISAERQFIIWIINMSDDMSAWTYELITYSDCNLKQWPLYLNGSSSMSSWAVCWGSVPIGVEECWWMCTYHIIFTFFLNP